MEFSYRETMALLHGIILGAFILLAFTGGLVEMWNLRTVEGVEDPRLTGRIRRVQIGTVLMAAVAWATVAVGTFIVYPWYRERTPDSPRSQLLANPDTKDWHEFGMEWKEHIGWISPVLATVVAVAAVFYGRRLATDNRFRYIMMGIFVLAFVVAAIAGIFGALITKKAPVQ
jgi:hypothetical protein